MSSHLKRLLPLLVLIKRMKMLKASYSGQKARKIFSMLLVSTIMAACSPVVVTNQERFFWPQPPNPPRIEWLAAYHSQLDLKMTAFRRFKEAITGQDNPVAIKKPVEVRADAVLDKFYVADQEAGAVFVFDLPNSDLRQLSMADTGLTDRITPIGLALDGERNLYLLEPRHRKILVYDHSEKYIRSIDLSSICKRPVAITIDKSRGRLYISDVQLSKIFALDLNGVQLFSFGSFGDAEGAFNKPVSLAIGAGGKIIVADTFNARIQIFDESGKFRRAFGKRGDGVGDFQMIKAVAVDPDDNIYVVDGRSHSINIFDQRGELLLTLGSYYSLSESGKTAPGGFSLPVGIDIDDRGRIFVADQLNSRIQVFQYLTDRQESSRSTPEQAK